MNILYNAGFQTRNPFLDGTRQSSFIFSIFTVINFLHLNVVKKINFNKIALKRFKSYN